MEDWEERSWEDWESSADTETKHSGAAGCWDDEESSVDTETKDAGAAGCWDDEESPADTVTKDACAAGCWDDEESPADTETKDAGAAGCWDDDKSPAVTPCHGGRFIRFSLYGTVFEVTAKYGPPIGFLGKGAYGAVCSIFDSKRKEFVAIKKIDDPFHDPVDAKRALREVKLLAHMHHENDQFYHARCTAPPFDMQGSFTFLQDKFSVLGFLFEFLYMLKEPE